MSKGCRPSSGMTSFCAILRNNGELRTDILVYGQVSSPDRPTRDSHLLAVRIKEQATVSRCGVPSGRSWEMPRANQDTLGVADSVGSAPLTPARASLSSLRAKGPLACG